MFKLLIFIFNLIIVLISSVIGKDFTWDFFSVCTALWENIENTSLRNISQ